MRRAFRTHDIEFCNLEKDVNMIVVIPQQIIKRFATIKLKSAPDIINISNGQVCALWNKENFLFYFHSSGDWYFENQDGYKAGHTIPPYYKSWVSRLVRMGFPRESAEAAWWEWKYRVDQARKIVKNGCREIMQPLGDT